MVTFNPAITERLNALESGVLNGHYIFSRDFEDTMVRRFSQPDKFAHNISYEFTNNPEMLQQYYNIREYAYKETLGLQHFSGQEDEFDIHSHILIVKAGGNVVGGARLIVSTPQNPQMIPLEEDGLDVKSKFPQLDFSQINYCEMSRLALLPEFRNKEIAEEIHRKFIDICARDNIDVGFARTTPLQQRRTKTIFNNLGYEMIVRRDIDVNYGDLPMLFSCVDFTPNREYTVLLKQVINSEMAEIAEHLEFA